MNQLIMTRRVYEGVTTMPHFPTSIDYQGCHIEFDDIYFDNYDTLLNQVVHLETTRKGSVVLDGGSRFGLTISGDLRGGLTVGFRAHPITYPGTLIIEGSFVFDGEHAAPVIKQFHELLGEGKELKISQRLHPGYWPG